MEIDDVKTSNLLNSFADYLSKENKSSLTIKNYVNDIESCLSSNEISFEAEVIKKICLKHLKDLLNANYSISSVKRKQSALKTFIKFLFHNGFISKDFSKEITIHYVGETVPIRRQLLSREELLAIDLAITKTFLLCNTKTEIYKASRNKLLYYLILNSGLKLSEVMLLQWEDVDFLKGVISVGNTKRRNVPLNENLKKGFEAHQRIIKSTVGDPQRIFKGFIFFKTISSDETKKHGHISAKTIDRIITNIMALAGIKRNVTAETIRQTMAYYSVTSKQVSLEELALLLGCESPKYAYNFYFNLIDELKERDGLY